MTLATYYWFSQTPLYTQTMIADLPWHVMLRYIMLGLGFLMISNVSYAAMPTIGYRSVREVLGSLLVVATIVGVIFLPKQFFFPALLGYVLYGIARTVFFGLLGRLPEEELESEESDDPSDDRPRRRRRRRRIRADSVEDESPAAPLPNHPS